MVCFKEVIRDEGFLVGACRRMCGIGVVRARTNGKVGADLRTVEAFFRPVFQWVLL